MAGPSMYRIVRSKYDGGIANQFFKSCLIVNFSLCGQKIDSTCILLPFCCLLSSP